MKFNKRSELGGLQILITTLVVVGLLIGIAFLILEEFSKQTDNYSATVTKETHALLSEVPFFATYNSTTAGIDCYNGFAVTALVNSTGGTTINTGNYTYNADTGSVTGLGKAPWNGTAVNVSYTYNYGKDACAGINDTIDATAQIPTWLSIIVILAIVGILLVIVFKVLPSAKKEGVAEI